MYLGAMACSQGLGIPFAEAKPNRLSSSDALAPRCPEISALLSERSGVVVAIVILTFVFFVTCLFATSLFPRRLRAKEGGIDS